MSPTVIDVNNTRVAGFKSRIRRKTTRVNVLKHTFRKIKIPKAVALKIRRCCDEMALLALLSDEFILFELGYFDILQASYRTVCLDSATDFGRYGARIKHDSNI